MASKIYSAPETAVVFKSSAGDVVFTPTSVTDGAGRVSAQWDRGVGSKPAKYRWHAKTKAGAALAVGKRLDVYFAFSDGTNVDGNVGTADAAVSSIDKLRNLSFVGGISADSTTNGEVQQASGWCWVESRYVSVVWWNALGQTLSATATDHVFTLIPEPDESQ